MSTNQNIVECSISKCKYNICSTNQNKEYFIDYCQNSLSNLNNLLTIGDYAFQDQTIYTEASFDFLLKTTTIGYYAFRSAEFRKENDYSYNFDQNLNILLPELTDTN